MWYFYKSCRFKQWIISSVQTISNTKTPKCSIKSMESMFNLQPFCENIENYEIYIFVQNSWVHQIAHIKYWIINDLTNDASVMVWFKRRFEITAAYLRRRPSTFWKTVQKSGKILHWKKRRLSEYVTKVIKNMFRKALFTRLIEKWLIYRKKKQLNDFGLEIRIFDISKIEFFEKNIFTGNCLCDFKISSVKIF